MNISILNNADELGHAAAEQAAVIINEAIACNGKARIVLSTGESQNTTLKSLLNKEIEWSKVEFFHLDEYIGLPITHPASFRKYLQERFIDFIEPGPVHFVNVEGDLQANIAKLTEEIRKEPIDLAFIGIGENAHIAFNDPPANFQTEEAYIVVDLDEACKRQQVGEGFFATIDDVPKQAVSMTVHQIMQSKAIISSVPDKRKANAVQQAVELELTNTVPATMLKKHPSFYLYLDQASASGLSKSYV